MYRCHKVAQWVEQLLQFYTKQSMLVTSPSKSTESIHSIHPVVGSSSNFSSVVFTQQLEVKICSLSSDEKIGTGAT